MNFNFFIANFNILSCLLTLAICDEVCKEQRALKVRLDGENELKFLLELKEKANEWDITVEKEAARLNTSFVFTFGVCKWPEIYSLINELDISNYEEFNPNSRESVNSRRRSFLHLDADTITKRYLSYDEGNEYIEILAKEIEAKNSKISVEVKTEGLSYEKREIKSVTVKYASKPNNPVMMIEAGMHAREWHARSMGLYLLRILCEEAALDSNGIIFNATFVIVPTANPDGYEYSRTEESLWRKTRSKNPESSCIGVDGNRNFDIHWRSGTEELKPCSNVYRGSMPFSEAETKVIQNLMEKVKKSCKMFISIHSYGNTILYPNGYTTAKHARDRELDQVAQAAAYEIKGQTGTIFIPDQSGSSLYVAAGGSDDYAIDVMKIPFAYTLELGAEDLGFAVPVEYLKQTLEEGWIVIKTMVVTVLTM